MDVVWKMVGGEVDCFVYGFRVWVFEDDVVVLLNNCPSIWKTSDVLTPNTWDRSLWRSTRSRYSGGQVHCLSIRNIPSIVKSIAQILLTPRKAQQGTTR